MLTDTAVRKAKPTAKRRKMYDGDGLFLLITPEGSKLWRFRYQRDKRENLLGLGVYPAVTLQQAREKCAAARAQLAAGVDPSPSRRHAATGDTLRAIADEWWDKFSPSWAPAHAARVKQRLSADALPWLGDKPIVDITAADVLAVLRRVEDRGVLETAHRVRASLGQVFRFAVATGRAERDPTADLRGALPPAVATHHAAITDRRGVGALLRAIEGYAGSVVVRVALRLTPLVFVRPGELRAAEWSEVDLAASEWRIRADRMKMKAPHVVPLARQARALLEDLHPATKDGRFVFPHHNDRARPMSENTISAALRGLGYPRDVQTAHGFRSIASTLLNESGLWSPDAIERQLAHAPRDKIRAAYNWTEYLAERRRMMQWWADELDRLRAL